MSASLADRLRVRWVVLLAVVMTLVPLLPSMYEQIRPMTLRFEDEVDSLVTTVGELTIDWDESEPTLGLLVRRWNADGTAVIVARVPMFSGDNGFVNPDFAMVCATESDRPLRLLFGAVGRLPYREGLPPADLIGYDGPPATGARLRDGMYLIALEPGPVAPEAAIVLRRSDRVDARTAQVFDDVVRYGRQTAGCAVA